MIDMKILLDSVFARNPWLKYDRDLDRALGARGQMVCHWRRGRSLPSDEVMPALCALAGVDLDETLAQLNAARAKNPEVKASYLRIAAKLMAAPGAAVLLLTTVAITSASAGIATGTNHPTVCQNYTLCDRVRRRVLRSFANIFATFRAHTSASFVSVYYASGVP